MINTTSFTVYITSYNNNQVPNITYNNTDCILIVHNVVIGKGMVKGYETQGRTTK